MVTTRGLWFPTLSAEKSGRDGARKCFLVMEKQQALGIKLDVPGLRAVAQGSPEFFGDVGLQVRSVARVGLRVQPEV